MNSRQKFIKNLLFESVDKIPLDPGCGRESTIQKWHSEGLPDNIEDPFLINEYVYKKVGGKFGPSA